LPFKGFKLSSLLEAVKLNPFFHLRVHNYKGHQY
jgi:hypothetical protein